MARAPAKWSIVLTLSGIVLADLGVVLLIRAEHHSSTLEWPILALYLPLLAVPAGILMTIAGTIAWARHFGRAVRLGAAVGFVLAGVLAVFGMDGNPHGSQEISLALVMSGAWFLSLVLIGMAIFKRSGGS